MCVRAWCAVGGGGGEEEEVQQSETHEEGEDGGEGKQSVVGGRPTWQVAREGEVEKREGERE